MPHENHDLPRAGIGDRLRELGFRIGALFRRRRIETSLSDEIELHLTLQTEANVAAGMPPEAARRAALREFGAVAQMQEAYRDARGLPLVDEAGRDVRFAVRGWRRNPGFAATALLTVALCLAANVVLFTLVDAVLLRPLPFPAARELVTVFNAYPKAGVERMGVSVPQYFERATGVGAFAEVAAFRPETATVGESGSPRRVSSLAVTPSFFPLLRSEAALGRTFSAAEGEVGSPEVVVLGDDLWREQFAADPAVVGRNLRVDGTMRTIVGVMPANFRFLRSRAGLWTPLRFSAADRQPDQRHMNGMDMVARLRPGTTAAAAQTQVGVVNQRGLAGDPYAKFATDNGFSSRVVDLHADTVAETRPVLWLLQAGGVALLLIGAVNLANLLLVRATARIPELALRSALGASRARIGRQLFTEILLLVLCGLVGGLGLGALALGSIGTLAGAQLPMEVDLHVGAAALGVGFAVAVLLSVGLAAATIGLGLRNVPIEGLASGGRGALPKRSTHRLRQGMIVAQFGLTCVLLGGAGLLGKSFLRVLDVDTGFRPDHVLSGTVALPQRTYAEMARRLDFLERVERSLRSVPGVTAVGIGTGAVPFVGEPQQFSLRVEDAVTNPAGPQPAHFMGGVSGGYFRALGIALREGRWLTTEDSRRPDLVCVVDEDFARYYWPGRSAVGRRVGSIQGGEPFTIVGVVGAVKHRDLADRSTAGTLYAPYSQQAPWAGAAAMQVTLVVRTAGDPGALASALRRAVQQVDPELPVEDIQTMESRVTTSLAPRRSPVLLTGLFAVAAVGLAGVGLYGVLAFAVAQRRGEIGVRLALGARPRQIRAQILGQAGQLVGIGLAFGAVGSWAVARVLADRLFGVGPLDWPVQAVTAAVLALIALVASWWPAARAARVEPAEALRGP